MGRLILVWGIVAAVATAASCAPLAGPTGDDAAASPMITEDFTFVSAGNTLSGVIDQPSVGEAQALIIFVHGYGETDVRGWNAYAELRTRFAELGIASMVWDKPGMGRSEGVFDINQPVEQSAQEVLDAIAYAREQNTPGAGKIGVWGVSRAGWIAPLAMAEDAGIEFWISVSGVTAVDNFLYLLHANLPHEGVTTDEADALLAEWRAGVAIMHSGGSFADYQAATENWWANGYVARMLGFAYTPQSYAARQAELLAIEGDWPVDRETAMQIHVHGFEAMLSGLDVDVLALFGENDLNVDWRKVRALYQNTIGQNPNATLEVHTFADANHNIDVAETGSLREMETMTRWVKSAGYYDIQVNWLRENVVE